MKFDVIVIGAGPAGISAAVYAVSRGLDVLVIERNKVGGIIGNVSTVTHYAGIIENETGASFTKRLENQALQAGVTIVYENVCSVQLETDEKIVKTTRKEYRSTVVIIANGTTPRKLEIAGEAELTGKGIGLNAVRDGAKYQGKNVYVIGGADGAIKEAIYLAQYAQKLTIIHFENKLSAITEFVAKIQKLENIEVKLETRLTGVSGKNHVEQLELTNVNTGEKEIIVDNGCGIFVYAGTVPNTEMYTKLKLESGFISVNDKMETSIPGIYAVGDIRVKQVRQVATAVSDGAIAAINAFSYIENAKLLQ